VTFKSPKNVVEGFNLPEKGDRKKMKKILGFLIFVGLALFAFGQIFAVEEGLVGCWSFDEGQGNIAYDSSGIGNHGTIYGATWTDGIVGKALSFDGVDDYVDCGVPSVVNFGIGDFTIECWVRLNSFGEMPARNPIISRWKELAWVWDLRAGWNWGEKDYLYFFTLANPDYGIRGSGPISLGMWHHVAVKRKNGNFYFYLDGEETKGEYDPSNLVGSTKMFMGRYVGYVYTTSFDGVIDEVRIYNRALSTEEIKEHYEVAVVVKAMVDIDPDTLNLGSEGKWITGYIELPSRYNVNNIDVRSIKLNNSVSAEIQPTEIGNYDKDSIADLMVKFDRSAVEKILPVGDKVTMTVSGQLTDGGRFEGSDTIRVIAK